MTETNTSITVYPAKPSALAISHPTHGKLSENGSVWPKDTFTYRRIADGAVTTTKPIAQSVIPNTFVFPTEAH